MTEKLYLIDGHALAYRTFFALNNGPTASRWQTASGEPTAGVFGFASVLLKILQSDKPDYIAVAFDTGKTFRDEMFPEYKATREKMPDDLRTQIQRIRQMVDTFNIPRLEVEGYEADDVLGTIAKQVAAKGVGVKIITGDRDLLQLVGGMVIVSLPEGGKLSDSRDYVTDEDVAKKFGVPAHLVVDYKALVGDASDNIPGVKGVGDKTAQNLFATYSSLEDIYDHIDDLKGKLREKLENDKEMAFMSQDLARIRTDVDIVLDLEKARSREFDISAVEDLFRELEFRNLIPKLKDFYTSENEDSAAQGSQMSMFANDAIEEKNESGVLALETRVVSNSAELAELVKTLEAADVIAFDTETTSTNEMQADLVGISLSVKAGEGWYIPVGHQIGTNIPLAEAIAAITPAMTDPAKQKIGHNLKYDAMILARNGLWVTPLSFDTMIAEFLIDPSSRNLGLKNLVLVRLGDEMTHIDELIGKGKNQLTMDRVAVDAAAPYAAADAEVCIRLRGQLIAELERDDLKRVFEEVEMPLIPVLARMEMNGIRLDTAYFAKFADELEGKLNELETNIHQMVGMSFNIKSTQQLSDVLFKNLALTPPPRMKKTASGHFSTAADVLDAIRDQHPIVDMVLEHRELAKLKSTYLDALPLAVDPDTGRVHTSFNQTGSVTGRLASNNPNLQNIPTRTETGKKVRNGFVAEQGNVLLSVDYSQVELRLVAVMSGDAAMLDAFKQGKDIHSATAAAILNKPIEEVTKDERRHAKSVNFGLIYGMSAFGLTRTTDLTLGEAERFVQKYFEQFPGIKKYLDNIKELAAKQGYITTMLGRRRYFPALKGMMNAQMRQREEREAINSPIQGTAADIMKIAMIKLPEALKAANANAKMLLQVHDEILFECPESELELVAKVARDTMENAFPLDVALETEARVGVNWGELKVI